MNKQPLKPRCFHAYLISRQQPGYVSTLLVRLGLPWVVRPQILFTMGFFSSFFVHS